MKFLQKRWVAVLFCIAMITVSIGFKTYRDLKAVHQPDPQLSTQSSSQVFNHTFSNQLDEENYSNYINTEVQQPVVETYQKGVLGMFLTLVIIVFIIAFFAGNIRRPRQHGFWLFGPTIFHRPWHHFDPGPGPNPGMNPGMNRRPGPSFNSRPGGGRPFQSGGQPRGGSSGSFNGSRGGGFSHGGSFGGGRGHGGGFSGGGRR